MANEGTPLKTANTRVWVIPGRARADHKPLYMNCMRAGGPQRSYGNVDPIQCPSPNKFGEFVDKGEIQGAVDRPSMDLIGRYAIDVASLMLELAEKRCALDVQVHMGTCKKPDSFTAAGKILVMEKAHITNWQAGDLGALASGDNSTVDETAPISASKMYEILRLNFSEKGGTIITNELIDGALCDAPSCGDCDTGESDGCYDVYFVSKSAGGSVDTPADVVYTLDKGLTWNTSEIDSLGIAEDPSGLACVGDYLVVVSESSVSLHYVLKSELDTTGDETWVEVGAGFIATNAPLDCWGVDDYLFVAAEGGYVYGTDDPTNGVDVLEAGVACADDLDAIHALDDEHAVAVGHSGAIVYTENQTIWQAANRPVGIGTALTCVWMKNETEWWVGTNTGLLYYTLDKGQTWADVDFPGSGAGVVWDIAFASDTVVFLSHATAAGVGRILKSNGGGYPGTWIIQDEVKGTIPKNDHVTSLVVCPYDVNVVWGGGLGDNGIDGFLVQGED